MTKQYNSQNILPKIFNDYVDNSLDVDNYDNDGVFCPPKNKKVEVNFKSRYNINSVITMIISKKISPKNIYHFELFFKNIEHETHYVWKLSFLYNNITKKLTIFWHHLDKHYETESEEEVKKTDLMKAYSPSGAYIVIPIYDIVEIVFFNNDELK